MYQNIANSIKYVDLLLTDQSVNRIDLSMTPTDLSEFIINDVVATSYVKLTFSTNSLLISSGSTSLQQQVNILKNDTISHIQLTHRNGTASQITLPWHPNHKDINAYETIFVSPNLISILVEVK